MFRGLLKLLLLIVVIVAAGAFLLGWWGGRVNEPDDRPAAVGTTGEAGAEAREKADKAADKTAGAAEVAKDRSAQAAEAAREATHDARKALAEGSLTAKIKAKMALDDHVKALNLDVDTVGTVVTVSGYVNTEDEKQRALTLARDTAGVTQVVDKIQIRR